MAADAHGPTPKGVLCNAGAGAAAGMSFYFIFYFSPPKELLVWMARNSRKDLKEIESIGFTVPSFSAQLISS